MVMAATLALPTHAIAEEDYVHCYIGEAPASAVASTELGLQGFLTSVQIATLRHGCNLDTGADKAMLDRRIMAAGCAPTSEVATFAAETFATSPAETLAMLRKDSNGDTALLTKLCEVAATCTPGELSFTPECEAAIADAMGR